MGYIHFQDIHKDFGQNKVLKGITLDPPAVAKAPCCGAWPAWRR